MTEDKTSHIAHDASSEVASLRRRVAEIEAENRQLIQSQQRQHRFRQLMEVMPYGVMETDTDGRITFCNQGLADILHMTQPQLVGTSWLSWYPDDEARSKATLNRTILDQQPDPFPHRTRITLHDGNVADLEMAWNYVRDAEGQITGFVYLVTDITARTRSDDQLRRSQQHLAEAQRIANIGSWEWILESNSFHWSDQMYRIWGFSPGYPPESLDQLLQRIHPDDVQRIRRRIDILLYNGTDFEEEFRIRRNDGQIRVVIERGRVIRDRDGRAVSIIGATQDITRQKHTTEMLAERTRQFESLANNAPDIIFRVDQQHRHIFVNRALLEMTGLTERQYLGKTNRQLGFPEPMCAFLEEHFARAFHCNEPLECLFDYDPAQPAHAAGTTDNLPGSRGRRHLHMRLVPETDSGGAVTNLLGITRDITDVVHATEELARQKEMLQSIIDNIPVMLTMYNEQGQVIFTNPAMQNILGWTNEHFEDGDILDRIFDDPQQRDDALQFMKDAPLNIWKDFRMNTASGAIVYTSWTNIRLTGEQYIGIGMDITERKKAEQDVREREQQLARAQSLARVGAWSLDIGADRPVWSEIIYDVFGLDPSGPAPTLEEHRDYFDLQDQQRMERALDRAFQYNRPYRIELKVNRRDGQVRHITSIGETYRDDAGKVVRLNGMIQDITDYKEVQHELQQREQTQKVLLREVNHRVKNNLSAIISLLHRQQERYADAGVTGYDQLLTDQIRRIQGLLVVHRLLSAQGWQPLGLSYLCETLIQATVRSQGSQKMDIHVNSSQVEVDSDQAHHLTMVINELITNTLKYAVPEGRPGRIEVTIAERDQFVDITYADDGPGFPDRMTKDPARHGRVGYDLVHGIVTQSLGGTLELYNRNGAVVFMTFPRKDTQ